MLGSFLKEIVKINGVLGAVVVNTQDGSVLSQEGDIDPSFEDIIAFFGSGFDVVASSLELKGLRYTYLERENQKIIILAKEEGYIGCKLQQDAVFEKVIEKIMQIGKPKVAEKVEAKKESVPTAEKSPRFSFLKSKVHQINLLIDEFSEGDDKKQWIQLALDKFSEDETGKKIIKSIEFGETIVISNGQLDPDIKEEDISAISKVVTDTLCRRAVEKYGATETKKMVHNVIEKLGIGK